MPETPIIKTPEMEQYEEETGNLAIWKGKVSKNFTNWQDKKIKEDTKKKKSETLLLSREERDRGKLDDKHQKDVDKDYEHLIVSYV